MESRSDRSAGPASRMDRALAAVCRSCPVCRHARKKQAGLAFRVVKTLEARTCPFCKAYERVHGRKSHEPLPAEGGVSR